jgi:hypothetical protein
MERVREIKKTFSFKEGCWFYGAQHRLAYLWIQNVCLNHQFIPEKNANWL